MVRLIASNKNGKDKAKYLEAFIEKDSHHRNSPTIPEQDLKLSRTLFLTFLKSCPAVITTTPQRYSERNLFALPIKYEGLGVFLITVKHKSINIVNSKRPLQN